MGTLSPVCILAGGMGTRLGSLVADTPKPLLPVAGRPFLEHQLDLLARYGAHQIVVCTGYLSTLISDVIGDGARFGLQILYSDDGPTRIGTAGAVRKALPYLGARFLVLYGDTYLRIDYADVDAAFAESGRPALMTVLRNEGRWDNSNVDYADGTIRLYDKRSPTTAMDYIDYGLSALTPGALTGLGAQDSDLADVFHRLSLAGQLAGYEANERFYEIGTPPALAEADLFLSQRTIG